MQLIKNTTLQSFNIPFNTPEGIKDYYLRSKSSLTLPNSYTSVVLDNLVRRKLVKVTKLAK